MPNYLNHIFYFFSSSLTNIYNGITIAKFKAALMLHHVHKTKAPCDNVGKVYVVNFFYSKYLYTVAYKCSSLLVNISICFVKQMTFSKITLLKNA